MKNPVLTTHVAIQDVNRELPLIRYIETLLVSYGYVKNTKEYRTVYDQTVAFHRKFGFINKG